MPQRTVFSCNFQAGHDLNSDRQPDGWRRRKDRYYPAYIGAEITSRDEVIAAQGRLAQVMIVRAYKAWKTGNWDNNYIPETIPPFLTKLMDGVVIRNCYEVQVDGGAFELVSPRFPINPQLSYRLSAEMYSEKLDSHSAVIELQVISSTGQKVGSFRTASVSGSTDWKQIESEVIELPNTTETLFGELHILVQPRQHGTGKGIVRIDNLAVHEMPRVSIESDLPFNIAQQGKPFEVNFQVIGQSVGTDLALLEIRDIDGRIAKTAEFRVLRTPLSNSPDSKIVSFDLSTKRSTLNQKSPVRRSKQSWTSTKGNYRLSLDQPGHYQVKLSLGDHISCEMPISVLSEQEIRRGMFGWTLSDLDTVLAQEDLVEMISGLGVGAVKLPIWIDYRDSARLQTLSKWLSQVVSDKVLCIGTMDHPIGQLGIDSTQNFAKFHASAILSDSNTWYESVEPILTNLGMKLSWIQVGADDDRTAVESDEIQKNLEAIRNHVHAIGQDTPIAVGWDWKRPVLSVSELSGSEEDNTSVGPWNALHLGGNERLSPTELLENAKSWPKSSIKTWTSLTPLSSIDNSTDQRVLDLAQQMISMRRSELSLVFFRPVVDNTTGLFDSEFRPSPLLLPWTHIADSISTRQYDGSIELINKSTNHVFGNPESSVALMWSDTPTTEQVFLGDGIEARDVWGRKVEIEKATFPSGSVASQIELGQWPLIISNVDREVVRWQQEFQLNSEQLSSQIADSGTLSVAFKNTLDTNVEVSLTALADTLIENGSVRSKLSLGPQERKQLDLDFQFLPDASAGDHSIEFAFEVSDGGTRRFSIIKPIKLGHKDLELHWNVQRLNDEVVELQVQVINNTNSAVSFDCKLFPRGAPYQRVLIVDAESGSSLHSRRVSLPKGRISQESPVWVRCEHIGSPLILNYRLAE